LPNTTDWFGRYRLAEDGRIDYGLDRERQRTQTYSGIPVGFNLQDQAVTESMGPVFDRSQEHLGTSDIMVIRMRRRLISAARALEADGTMPPGVDDPEAYQQRSGGVILAADDDWLEATSELRRSGVDVNGIDLKRGGGA
jgi:hypothetical protein